MRILEFYDKLLANKEVSDTVEAAKKKQEAEAAEIILDASIDKCSHNGKLIWFP